VQFRQPSHGRALPELNRWRELSPLLDAPEANDDRGGVLWRHCKERGRALGAEDLCTPVAAFCNLDIGLRLTTEHESLYRRRHGYSERRTREHLAVGAVANHHPRGIDFSSKGNQAAVAGAVDLHAALSVGYTLAYDVQGMPTRISAKVRYA